MGLERAESEVLASSLAVYGIVPESLDSGFHSFELFEGCFAIVLDWARLSSDRLLSEGRYLILAAFDHQPQDVIGVGQAAQHVEADGLVGARLRRHPVVRVQRKGWREGSPSHVLR